MTRATSHPDASGARGPHPGASILALRRALAAQPEHRGLRLELLACYAEQGRFEEALPLAEALRSEDPADDALRTHLARALAGTGRIEEALATLAGHPKEGDRCLGLGLELARLGHREATRALCLQALEAPISRPDLPGLFAHALQEVGCFEESLALLEGAEARFASEPAILAELRMHQSHLHLLRGDFARGWPLLEARFEMAHGRPRLTPLPLPAWDGTDPAGRTLVLRWDQGMGDGFMMLRYARVLWERGAHVVAECPPAARGVVRTCPGVAELLTDTTVLPPGSVQAALLSLPGLLGTTSDRIPWDGPYLSAPSGAAPEGLPEPKDGIRRLGLVWAGNPDHARDWMRSLPPEALAPLAQVPGLAWVSLQVGDAPKPPLDRIDLGPRLHDWSDTARALQQLDGLVTIDTGIAHLAGAMGLPTCLLLPSLPDWRWMLERPDSPWYPSLRLFRQPEPGDWDGAIAALAAHLS